MKVNWKAYWDGDRHLTSMHYLVTIFVWFYHQNTDGQSRCITLHCPALAEVWSSASTTSMQSSNCPMLQVSLHSHCKPCLHHGARCSTPIHLLMRSFHCSFPLVPIGHLWAKYHRTTLKKLNQSWPLCLWGISWTIKFQFDWWLRSLLLCAFCYLLNQTASSFRRYDGLRSYMRNVQFR